MRSGEETDVDIDVPEGASPNIAGKNLRFHLHLKEVKEAHPPELDEEFVKSLGRGYTGTEDLRADVVKEMESMEDANARGHGISELLSALLEAHPFEVPPTLVKGEADEQIREYERRLRQENPDVQLSEAKIEELREEVRPRAEERVRQLIIVERIREAEEIEASAEEVESQIRISAARYGMTPEKLRERMMTTGAMASLVSNINYNKTVSWLYNQADVEFDVHDAAGLEAQSRDSDEDAGEERSSGGDSKEDG
jgi:trigger factor